MEVTLAALKVLAVHGNGLKVVLVLVLKMFHFLDVHADLDPEHIQESKALSRRGEQCRVFSTRG